MYDGDGNEVDLLKSLRSLESKTSLDLEIHVIGENRQQIPLRVCAIRKTEEAILAAKRKLQRQESKRQKTFSDGAKEFNEYIILITNLPDTITADQVLELYRLRWQVEIHFKRLKSILDYGELPKRRPESVMAWLNGKMMIALLIEKIIGGGDFSPTEECIA